MYKRILIKLGSSAITKDEGGVDLKKIENIVQDIKTHLKNNLEIILVSSGAIQTGREILKNGKNIDFLQACSAVGQPRLMKEYVQQFEPYPVAQVLLTHDDLGNRRRYLNTRNTLLCLLQNKITPILNENDTVSYEEITVGDNDQLAVMTGIALSVDLILIFSSPDGVFESDPSEGNPKKISHVNYDDQLDIDTSKKSTSGRGGMKSKILAAKLANSQGIPVVIATYKSENPISRVLNEKAGTYFEPKKIKTSKFKSWMTSTLKPKSCISVDEGAAKALKKNASLLPKGITSVEGSFKRGDCVKILFKKSIIALGLSEFDSKDVKKILGCHSSEIKNFLPDSPSEVVIHRNNMVLKDL